MCVYMCVCMCVLPCVWHDDRVWYVRTKTLTVCNAEQSRAEQSRAEQSRAEQSRAEQSRAEQSRAEQWSGVQCSAVQWSAVEWSGVQWSAVQCSAVQCSAVHCSAVQCTAAYDKIGAIQFVIAGQYKKVYSHWGRYTITVSHPRLVVKGRGWRYLNQLWMEFLGWLFKSERTLWLKTRQPMTEKHSHTLLKWWHFIGCCLQDTKSNLWVLWFRQLQISVLRRWKVTTLF